MYQLKVTDTDYIDIILSNPYDPRVTFAARYYGQSVYESKMNAMHRISNVSPGKKIGYRVDSSIIQFYTNWAIEKGYLKK